MTIVRWSDPHAQWFDPNGAFPSPATRTFDLDIARLPDGGMVVVGLADPTSQFGYVFSQRFDALGRSQNFERVLSYDRFAVLTDPLVSSNDAGGLLYGAVAKTFIGTGVSYNAVRLYPAPSISTMPGYVSNDAPALIYGDGGAVVLFGRDSQSTVSGAAGLPEIDPDVFVTSVAPDWTWRAQLPLAELTAGAQARPAITKLADGTYLAAWHTTGNAQAPTAAGISARRLDATFQPIGAEIAVAAAGVEVALAGLADGRVALAYEVGGDVRARVLDPAAIALTAEVTLVAGVARQYAVKLTATKDGGYAAAWMEDASGQTDVYVRTFDAAGNPTSAPFQVLNTGNERLDDLTTLTDGRLVVAWSEGALGTGRVQILDPRDGSVTGTIAADVLTGSDAYHDTVTALSGNDTVDGLWGNDLILLGDGSDMAFGSEGDDWIEGGGASDWIVGGAGQDLAHGGEGNDLMSGAAGRDWFIGDAGNDTIWGGDDADVLSGGEGDDYILGEIAPDLLYGGGGNDVFILGRADDLDWIFGEEGADTLYFRDRSSIEVASIAPPAGSFGQVTFTDGSYVLFTGIEWVQFTDRGWAVGA